MTRKLASLAFVAATAAGSLGLVTNLAQADESGSDAGVVVDTVAIADATPVSDATTTTSTTAAPTTTTTTTIPARTPEGLRLLVLGDSLVFDSTEQIHAAAAVHGFDSEVQAFGGTTVGWAIERLGQRDAESYDIIIIASGTNNMYDGWDDGDMDEVTSAVTTFATLDACTAWVMPMDRLMLPGSEDYRAFAVDYLTGLYDALADTGIGRAPWAVVASERADWFDEDGIHHTPAGKVAYGEFIVDQALACV